MAEEETAPNQEQEEPRSLSLLASEHFGKDYYGEVKQDEPVDETPEEPQGDSPDAEASDEEPVEQPEEAVEYDEYELPHIAQLLGVDEDQLDVEDDGRVVLRGKVDGENVKANVKDLLSNYQMYQAADKRLEEAKERARTQNQELAQKSEEINGRYATAEKMIEKAESLLSKETKQIDWQDLRENDPAEYSAKKAELAERKEEIERMRQEAADEYQKDIQKQQEEYQQNMAQYLQQEQEKLVERLPEWKDGEKAKSEKSKIAEYLSNEGFSKEEIANASDHRLIVMARKAMMFDQNQANVEPSKKKVVRIPKAMKPGSPKPQGQIDEEQYKKARGKLKKSGRLDDALAVMRARRIQ